MLGWLLVNITVGGAVVALNLLILGLAGPALVTGAVSATAGVAMTRFVGWRT